MSLVHYSLLLLEIALTLIVIRGCKCEVTCHNRIIVTRFAKVDVRSFMSNLHFDAIIPAVRRRHPVTVAVRIGESK